MNLDDKIEITLRDLVEFTREYDGNGDNNYPESEYEGIYFMIGLVEHLKDEKTAFELAKLLEYAEIY